MNAHKGRWLTRWRARAKVRGLVRQQRRDEAQTRRDGERIRRVYGAAGAHLGRRVRFDGHRVGRIVGFDVSVGRILVAFEDGPTEAVHPRWRLEYLPEEGTGDDGRTSW